MSTLVSIIIPCYNAEQWITEAIDSCLQQTYSPIEIIVIDDGSTDQSLEKVKRYGDRVIWETGPNRGGNYARNRGFALSKGEYIQYLDADDYLLPEKIERQVRFLEDTHADVVYGDWRYQYHNPDGDVHLDDIKISGSQPDILESLLAGWWVSPACLFFRRSAVERSGGWDETLKAGQDRDFFISVVMAGATVDYQPGCYSIYRRYGKVTVSTSSKTRYLENHRLILEKVERNLANRGQLSTNYRNALAQSYFTIARSYLNLDSSSYFKFLDETLRLSPNFQAQSTERTALYNWAQMVFGFRRVERFVYLMKQIKANLSKTKHIQPPAHS